MYTRVQEFQKKVAQILAQMDKTKTKNTKFVGIRMGLDEMRKWIEDNLEFPQSPPKDDWMGKKIKLCFPY
jgi:hypothetical protein